MSCNEDVETFQLLHFESLFKKMHQFLAHHSKFKSDKCQSIIFYKNNSESEISLHKITPSPLGTSLLEKNHIVFIWSLSWFESCWVYSSKAAKMVFNG